MSNREHLADRPITWEDTVYVYWETGAGVFLET